MQLLAFGDGIADLEHATRIGQSYDIAWPSLVDGTLTLCHKLRGRGKSHRLPLPYMQIGHIALETS